MPMIFPWNVAIRWLVSILMGCNEAWVQLCKKPGLFGLIFRKAQNKVQDPAKLRRLIADVIDKKNGHL
jgi:hypothetical protein